jgi:pimeloyl-ACP methyl ester carboxylesterase
MSALTIEQDLVHYEALGRGRPVILVHGWLGSWRYWIPAMQQLSGKYRSYALDLWGFGESAKEPLRYGFEEQVRLLNEFMERLGIAKAALVGHGLGAAIVTRFALQAPDRVSRVMAVSPPLFHMPPAPEPVEPPNTPRPEMFGPIPFRVDTEAETIGLRTEEMNARLRAAFEREAQRLAAGIPAPEPPAETRPPLPNPLRERLETVDPVALLTRHADPGPNLDKLLVEVRKADPAAVAQTIETMAGVDTLRELQRVQPPVLAVYGSEDTMLPAPDSDMLNALRADGRPFHAIEMRGLRHFPMLDDIAAFNRLLMDFLEAADPTRVTIKERWERRVR